MNLSPPIFLSTVAVRTAIILLIAVVGLRFFGKRQVGELNVFDITLILLLGNAIQNAITYGSGDLWVGLVSAGTLLVIERVLGLLTAGSTKLARRVLGEPTVLVIDGRFDDREMKKQGVTKEEVLTSMRDHGLDDPDQIGLAVLEIDGDISIIKRKEE